MRKGGFSKFIIAMVIVLNTLFAATVLYVFLKTSSEPSTLVGVWFGFTTGELWILAKIKRERIKKAKDPEKPEENGGEHEN